METKQIPKKKARHIVPARTHSGIPTQRYASYSEEECP